MTQNKTWWIAITGVLALIAVYVVIVLLLVKLLWAWTIPDIFPGAVSQGLIAGSISWYTAFKIAVFVAVLAGLAGVRRGRES
jgi:CDP-diglyceride synthetase